MSIIKEIIKARTEKLEAIKMAGFSVYPSYSSKIRKRQKISDILKSFPGIARSKKEIIAVGRIRTLRAHGKITFLDINDESGMIQGLFRENILGEKQYKFFIDHFDIGDFIELKGVLFKTKKGERTIEVKSFKMLGKSILPLPEKWHGLQDEEERFRKRYLDLIFNTNVKENFKKRSLITKVIREFLENEGFLEVETPVLQSIYGGADAKPFATHLNAFDMDVYLRIALELPLKRLLVGGFEKVYEIGRVFRNEGVDRQHNPDFTMLEFYWAYADYKDLMTLTEKLFTYLLKKVYGRTKVLYEDKDISFKAPWKRIEYRDLIKDYTKLDIDSLNKEALAKEAKKLGINIEAAWNKSKIIDEVYKKYCRPKIWDPTFVIHHPSEMKPLAKTREDNPAIAESFQLIVAGWELINAFSELNNPIEQKKRFEEQERFFKEGLEDAQRMDADFVEALEYGMPPAAGFGMGIDRLVALLTNSHSLREIILFPTMKSR